MTEGLEPGPVLFARYAYPPNELGYCGPADHAEFLGLASEATDIVGLSHLASRFEGAWPYLQLIARCNHIADPLDTRVVAAYWTGNELLTRVPLSSMAASLGERFERQAGPSLTSVRSAPPAGLPHHSFHVFAVYPWLGLLRAGREGPPLEVLDRCRIRWGRVEAVDGDLVTVCSRRLCFDGAQLSLGAEVTERVRRGRDGLTLLGGLRPDDVVSLHWDWVCDRLSASSLRWLQYCTARNLAAVNALPRAGPALVCER